MVLQDDNQYKTKGYFVRNTDKIRGSNTGIVDERILNTGYTLNIEDEELDRRLCEISKEEQKDYKHCDLFNILSQSIQFHQANKRSLAKEVGTRISSSKKLEVDTEELLKLLGELRVNYQFFSSTDEIEEYFSEKTN